MIRLLTFDSFRHYDILAKIHSNLTTAVLFSKKRHILMRIRQGLLLHHFFFAEGNETPSKKTPHLDQCCFVFDERPLNAALHKKTEPAIVS